MPVQTRSMTKAAAAARPKTDSERNIEIIISGLIYNRWYASSHAEATRQTIELFKYILIPEVADYVVKHDYRLDYIYFKLTRFQSSDIIEDYADIIKRVSKRFFPKADL